MLIKIPKDQKTQLIGHMQQYFLEERGEELGELAAELLLDFVMKEIGPFIYNQALDDIQTVLNQKMSSLDEDISALKLITKG